MCSSDLENWVRIISEDDTVIICGDISWGLKLCEAMADLRWIAGLPGHKVITKGKPRSVVDLRKQIKYH